MRRDVSTEETTKAIQKSVRRALREHALLGRSVPFCEGEKGEKIVYITPRDLIARLKKFEVEDGQVIPEYAPFIHGEQSPSAKKD